MLFLCVRFSENSKYSCSFGLKALQYLNAFPVIVFQDDVRVGDCNGSAVYAVLCAHVMDVL